MIDRKLLKLAQEMGHNCYLEGKDINTTIPWSNTPEYKVYADQMRASYKEAKLLFETEKPTDHAKNDR